MVSTPIDLILYLHKVDDRMLFLFSEYDIIHHESCTIVIYAPSAQLLYPVGLHDRCLDSTAASYFKPTHESPGAADLSLWRSPLW